MAGNHSNLVAAKRAKNDEFYTQLTDIEKELRHYRKHFRGKTVLCNCDDPFESNFFKFFVLNFKRLGLKKLIATCYDGSAVADYRNGKAKPYKAVVTTVHDTTEDGDADMEDIRNLFELGENELVELEGNGDFRSEECLALLDEADIVVTNPPFSLFREYVAVLMKHKKKFVIVGNKNAITYKEIFPLLKDDVVWLGCESPCEFFTPEGMTKKVNGLTRWFTNLDIKKRHEELILVKKYAGHENEYPTYDNYDAIEVSKVADIPFDYAGVMGVPITFLDKYNPEQFEIIGSFNDYSETDVAFGYVDSRYVPTISKGKETSWNGPVVNKKPLYKRIAIRNKHPEQPKEFTQRDGTVKKFGNICWFTNLDIQKRHEELILVKKYAGHENEYPKYDNYDAIEVSKVADIPLDYDGVMGVPITFLDKYNPEQFEIIKFRKGDDDKDLSVNGKCPYFRILIRHKHPEQPKEV